MTCPACQAAHARTSHLFHNGCKGCAARAIARGRKFRKSQQEGYLTNWYRRELEQFGVTHAEVREEHARDAINRAKETA